MAGRPAAYSSVEELDGMIEAYFKAIKTDNEPATITGLAYYLGFESRQSFYDYEKNGEFSYTIKRSRLKIESEYEKKLSGPASTGSIFALKNFGWKDKTEQDVNVSGGVQLVFKKAGNEAV